MDFEALLFISLAVIAVGYLTGLPLYLLLARTRGHEALASALRLIRFAICVFPAFAFLVLLVRDLVLRFWPSVLPEQSPDFAWVVVAPLLTVLLLAIHVHAISIARAKVNRSVQP